MMNKGFQFKLGPFIIAILILLIPVLVIYIRTKSKTYEENLQRLNKIAFFANNLLLYLTSLSVLMITLVPYYGYINSDNIDEYYKDFMGTGILLPFILWILGLIIRNLYIFVLKVFKTEDVLGEDSKETILTVSLLILLSLFLSVIDFKIKQVGKQFMLLLFILSVILGKYIWLDTTYDKLSKQFKGIWKKDKYSILIGGSTLVIMIILRIMPLYIELSTAVSFGLGLLVSLFLLTTKAIRDYKKGI